MMQRRLRSAGRGWRAWTLGLVLLAAGAACSRSSGGTETAGAQPAGGKRYPLHGEIVAVNLPRKTLTVAHEEIPGLMPAMTMEYAAADGDLAIAKPGQKIKARLVEDHGAYRLEDIWPDDRVSTSTVAEAANVLRQDTMTRARGAYREIGENMPDFALYDQDGRVVSAARFRGRQIMLNFIYTRCPVATMCPAATLRMMEVQQQARAAGVTNLQLISISLDPSYDTPGVLKEYAKARGIDTGNFTFLTGPEPAIRDLLTQFGVIAEYKDGLLKHSLATVLINAQGRIVHRADGSEWTVGEFVDRMHKG